MAPFVSQNVSFVPSFLFSCLFPPLLSSEAALSTGVLDPAFPSSHGISTKDFLSFLLMSSCRSPLAHSCLHRKFPDITVSTGKEPRVFCHYSRRTLFFCPHLEMRVQFPALSGKESLRSCHTSRGGDLNVKLERNSRGRATIPKDPDVPIHSRYTWFPCTDSTVIEHRLKTRWHV